MVPFTSVYIDFLYLASAVGMWFFLLVNVVLTFAAMIHTLNSEKERDVILKEPFQFPFVSILIPAHNEGLVISRTIEAMLMLNYPKERLEVIVINDGSTDDTGEIAQVFADRHSHVKVVNVPPGEGGKGKSRTLNVGLRYAKGEVISIYDADNRPDPNTMLYLIANLVKNPDLGAVLGKVRTINARENLLTRFINIEFHYCPVVN